MEEPIVKEIRLPDGRLASLEEALAFEEVVAGDYLIVLDEGKWRSLYSVEEGENRTLYGEEFEMTVRCQGNNIYPDIISANFFPDATYDVTHEQLAQFSREFADDIYDKSPCWSPTLVYLNDGWLLTRGVLNFRLINHDKVQFVRADVDEARPVHQIETGAKSYGQPECWRGFPYRENIGFLWESSSKNIALAIPDEDAETYSVYIKLDEEVRQERDSCRYGEYFCQILS